MAKLSLVAHKRFEKKYHHSRKWAQSDTLFWEIRSRLKRTGHHPELRACKMRAVIDAPFQSARMGEAIVTFRYLQPQIISLNSLDTITRAQCQRHKSEYVFQSIKLEARRHSQKRKAVNHLSWK